MTNTIDRTPKTLETWEALLMPSEMEALHDNYHTNPLESLTPGEVLEAIVNWEGGIASAYHIKSIISRVYGVEL